MEAHGLCVMGEQGASCQVGPAQKTAKPLAVCGRTVARYQLGQECTCQSEEMPYFVSVMVWGSTTGGFIAVLFVKETCPVQVFCYLIVFRKCTRTERA